MRNVSVVLLAAVALCAAVAQAQTPAPAAGTATVKALQPGLLEVTGPRVNEVVAAGVQKITASTNKGWRSIFIQSPWGDSYFGWPKNVKPVAFTIVTNGPSGTATISAPGYNDSNKADYKAAIESVTQFAITRTQQNKKYAEGSQGI